jgi:hypothetical protein
MGILAIQVKTEKVSVQFFLFFGTAKWDQPSTVLVTGDVSGVTSLPGLLS